jgi:uncharacterized protein Yka (UPF0111/DUF47 family)
LLKQNKKPLKEQIQNAINLSEGIIKLCDKIKKLKNGIGPLEHKKKGLREVIKGIERIEKIIDQNPTYASHFWYAQKQNPEMTGLELYNLLVECSKDSNS